MPGARAGVDVFGVRLQDLGGAPKAGAIYVDPEGNGDFLTLAAALSVATSGDEIICGSLVEALNSTVPDGLDTCRDITVMVRWFVAGAATGDVELEFIEVPFELGDDVNSGNLPETTNTDITTISVASSGILQETSFTIKNVEAIPGDAFGYAIRRDATAGNPNDTLADSIRIVTVRAEGTFWR